MQFSCTGCQHLAVSVLRCRADVLKECQCSDTAVNVCIQALALGEIPRRDNVGLGLGWLERAVDAVGRTWHGMDGGAMGDAVESMLLLALCGCLWLVLWRRRNLRAGQQQV